MRISPPIPSPCLLCSGLATPGRVGRSSAGKLTHLGGFKIQVVLAMPRREKGATTITCRTSMRRSRTANATQARRRVLRRQRENRIPKEQPDTTAKYESTYKMESLHLGLLASDLVSSVLQPNCKQRGLVCCPR